MPSFEVRLPTVVRQHAGSAVTVTGDGDTVGELFADLVRQYPGLRNYLISDDGTLHRFVNVYVNDEDIRYLGQLDTAVVAGDDVSILPAVAGG